MGGTARPVSWGHHPLPLPRPSLMTLRVPRPARARRFHHAAAPHPGHAAGRLSGPSPVRPGQGLSAALQTHRGERPAADGGAEGDALRPCRSRHRSLSGPLCHCRQGDPELHGAGSGQGGGVRSRPQPADQRHRARRQGAAQIRLDQSGRHGHGQAARNAGQGDDIRADGDLCRPAACRGPLALGRRLPVGKRRPAASPGSPRRSKAKAATSSGPASTIRPWKSRSSTCTSPCRTISSRRQTAG